MQPIANHNSLIGIGYRAAIGEWTRENLDRFDVLEITVDHCIDGGKPQQSAIFDLVGRIPLTAHGIGLSIGTDVPLDLAYLDEVAAIVERLKAPAYSEHLAFTRVPGRDLANLLPLPKTEAVAESIIAKVRTVQSRIPVPFLLENITYLFDWPDSETVGCGVSQPDLPRDRRRPSARRRKSLSERPQPWLRSVRISRRPAGRAGEGSAHGRRRDRARGLSCDGRSSPIPIPTRCPMRRSICSTTCSRAKRPQAIVLERDDRLDAVDEILDDVARIRARIASRNPRKPMAKRLLDRQVSLLEYLTSRGAIFGDGRGRIRSITALHGIDRGLLRLEARFSHEKRMEKIGAVFPRTFELLGGDQAPIVREFVEACPPIDIGRLENARQFYDFLCARWQRKPPSRRICATSRPANLRARRSASASKPGVRGSQLASSARRAAASAVAPASSSCAAPTISGRFSKMAREKPRPAERDTPLAVAMPPGAERPRVFEVLPVVFDLLAALDDWTDPAELGATPESDEFIAELARARASRGARVRICVIGKFPPIQGGVSMRTYWSAHAPGGARARGPCRDQCQGGAATVSDAHAGAGLAALRGAIRHRFGDGALDRPRRPLAVLHSDGQPVRLEARRPSRRACIPSARSTSSIRTIWSPMAWPAISPRKSTGVPHVVRMAGSDAGPPLASSATRGALRPRAALGRGRDRRRHGRGACDCSVASRLTVSPSAADSWCRRICSRPDGPRLDLAALRAEVEQRSRPPRPDVGRVRRRPTLFRSLRQARRKQRDRSRFSPRCTGSSAPAWRSGWSRSRTGSRRSKRAFRARARKLGLADRILQIPFLPHWRVPEFLRGCLAVCCLEQDFPIGFHTPIIPREVLLCGTCLVGSTEVIRKLPNYGRLPHGYGCVAIEDVNDIQALSSAARRHRDRPRAGCGGRRARTRICSRPAGGRYFSADTGGHT